MSSLALLFVGAVLMVNGLVLLGAVQPRAAVPINIIAGSGLLTASLLTAIPAADEPRIALFSAVGFGLFGATYLTVAWGAITGADSSGLGWYCAWASTIAAVLAFVNFAASDPRMAWLWVAWTILFFAFFLSCVRPDRRFTVAAGVLAIAQSVTTATIPALLLIDGSWDTLGLGWIVGAQAAALLTALGVASRHSVPSTSKSNPSARARFTG